MRYRGRDAFVVRDGDRYFAYLNLCPHQGVALDWDNEQFLDIDGELIQCAMHGALFSIDTGICLAGPCHGEHLIPIHTHIEDGWLCASDTQP